MKTADEAMSTLERRGIIAEVRAVDDELHQVDAVVLTFGTVDDYSTTFLPGSFDPSQPLPVMAAHHDWSVIIGRAIAVLEHSEQRLVMRFQLADEGADEGDWHVPAAREAWSLIKQGSLRGMSIGFQPVASEVITMNGQQVEQFSAIQIREVSAVLHGAVPGTGIISARAATQELNPWDEWLRRNPRPTHIPEHEWQQQLKQRRDASDSKWRRIVDAFLEDAWEDTASLADPGTAAQRRTERSHLLRAMSRDAHIPDADLEAWIVRKAAQVRRIRSQPSMTDVEARWSQQAAQRADHTDLEAAAAEAMARIQKRHPSSHES